MFLFLHHTDAEETAQDEVRHREAEKYKRVFDIKLNAAINVCDLIIADKPENNPNGYTIKKLKEILGLLIQYLTVVEYGYHHFGNSEAENKVKKIIASCQAISKRRFFESKARIIHSITRKRVELKILQEDLNKNFSSYGLGSLVNRDLRSNSSQSGQQGVNHFNYIDSQFRTIERMFKEIIASEEASGNHVLKAHKALVKKIAREIERLREQVKQEQGPTADETIIDY